MIFLKISQNRTRGDFELTIAMPIGRCCHLSVAANDNESGDMTILYATGTTTTPSKDCSAEESEILRNVFGD